MRMILTFQCELEIDDLEDYEATTLEEAVANQKKWWENGTCDPYDFAGDMMLVDIKGVL
jgi:hypothetical protein